jgi:SagB-type dehydrogenase family enzyme
MRWLVVGVVVIVLAGCGAAEPVGGAGEATAIELPEPALRDDVSLAEALASRRSVREFSDVPLDRAELSDLLWAAQGVTSTSGKRTAPSAGALYPLEVYAATPDGLYHYDPDGHRLELVQRGDLRSDLSEVALGQNAVADGAVVFVITAVYARTAQKYLNRAERYVHMEAGHAAQNLLLQATALGLGAVPIGAFADEEVQVTMGIPGDHEPLYLIPVGHLHEG